ncbi:MAG: alpha/beta hydrolase-fold protein [Gammaproteobacteria bacterium]|nr:alpha/beta hydrolase-fold protein [Gammaproteobacteria bacterium]
MMFRFLFAALLVLPFSVSAAPLTIGETFTLESEVLEETRRINVFVPTKWGEPIEQDLPVLYMPDGGMGEDFLHIAGLLQVSVSNETMRPFMLVGIENTARERDLTGPTTDERDLAMAPEVGGSENFRKFLRDELFPEIASRYPVTDERAIIGESLAGLFVIDTLLHEPEMFDTWIAVDPSLWWNFNEFTKNAAKRLANINGETLFIAAGKEAGSAEVFNDFIEGLRQQDRSEFEWHYAHMPDETHATIYHPAAVRAVRTVFPPETGTATEQ